MIDVISTNAAPVAHALANGPINFGFSKEQIATAMLAVRWMHLEAPTIGKAIYRAGVWIDSHGGFRGIASRLIGQSGSSALVLTPKGQAETAGVSHLPLNSSLG